MAKMAKRGILCDSIYAIHDVIKIPRTEGQEGKTQALEFPAHDNAKAVIERHPAMSSQHHPDGCLPGQNGTAKNWQTCWRHTPTGAAPPDQRTQPTSKPMTPLPWPPPAPPGNNAGALCSQIVNLQAGYVSSHTSLSCAEFFTRDAYALVSHHNTVFDPDMLTDAETSAG